MAVRAIIFIALCSCAAAVAVVPGFVARQRVWDAGRLGLMARSNAADALGEIGPAAKAAVPARPDRQVDTDSGEAAELFVTTFCDFVREFSPIRHRC